MGRRLQLTAETLDKRGTQLDAREAAFAAKRVKVAEQHETYVARTEERERRTREEAQLTQSNLQARLQEKDQAISQLQERLSAAQQEYELLRRRTARYLTEQTDTDGQRLRDQECALALVRAQLTEAHRQLRDKTADAERLAEEKLQLQGQLREMTRQLSVVTRKYHKLSEESHTREWEHLRKEQEALEAAKRAQALYANRGERCSVSFRAPPHPTAPSPQGLLDANTPQILMARTVECVGGRDEFYDMLSALKQEVSAGLTTAARGSNHNHHHHRRSSYSSNNTHTRSLPFKIVERPPDVPRVHSWSGGEGGVPPRTAAGDTMQRQAAPAAEQDTQESTQCAESEIAKEETSSLSAALSAIHDTPPHALAKPSSSSSPLPLSSAGVLPQRGEASGGDVVVDMGDTSLESYYPRVELQSWTNSLMADGDDTHAVAPLPPPARAGTLPPLAPELRGLNPDSGDDRERGVQRATSKSAMDSFLNAAPSLVSPTPEDFVLAREAPLTDAASKTEAARRDMNYFVQQLKMNREKLLETGVYSEQDHVVQEMGEKIRMYEEYLAQHP